MFDAAAAGSAVTVGLVVICFAVSTVVLGIATWINRKHEKLKGDLETFKLQIAREYLSSDKVRDLVQSMIDKLEARFDGLAEKIDLIGQLPPRARPPRTTAPRRKPSR